MENQKKGKKAKTKKVESKLVEAMQIQPMQVLSPCTTECVSTLRSCSFFTLPEGFTLPTQVGTSATILADASGLCCSVEPCTLSGTIPNPCGPAFPTQMEFFQYRITGSIYLTVSIPVVDTTCPPTTGPSGFLSFTDRVLVNIVQCISSVNAPCPTGCLLQDPGPISADVTIATESPLTCGPDPGRLDFPRRRVTVVEVSAIPFTFINLCPSTFASCTNDLSSLTVVARQNPIGTTIPSVTLTTPELGTLTSTTAAVLECMQNEFALIVGTFTIGPNPQPFRLTLNALTNTAILTFTPLESAPFPSITFRGCNILVNACPTLPTGTVNVTDCEDDDLIVHGQGQFFEVIFLKTPSRFATLIGCNTDVFAIITGILEGPEETPFTLFVNKTDNIATIITGEVGDQSLNNFLTCTINISCNT